MDRIVTTNPMVGIIAMQVCAEADVTDEEILRHCNQDNPSGTTAGWCKVVRTEEDGMPNALPGPCAEHKGRTHFIVTC